MHTAHVWFHQPWQPRVSKGLQEVQMESNNYQMIGEAYNLRLFIIITDKTNYCAWLYISVRHHTFAQTMFFQSGNRAPLLPLWCKEEVVCTVHFDLAN